MRQDHPGHGGPVAKKGKRRRAAASSAYEWTGLEKALVVMVIALVCVAAYGFLTNEEVVEVASIETYQGRTDLRAGDEANSSYSFVRELKVDYQIDIKYEVPYSGTGLHPLVHFKVWNETTGKKLVSETTASTYKKNIRLDAEDAGTYEFIWWVEGEGGSSQVSYTVLIEPTEKLFMEKT